VSRILLDTNALIWALGESSRLSPVWRGMLADAENEVFFSAVSVAEISVKQSLGKLAVPDEYPQVLTEAGYVELPLTAAHAHALRGLAWHHRDPFDRVIIAQALVEGMSVMTTDDAFARYGVALV